MSIAARTAPGRRPHGPPPASRSNREPLQWSVGPAAGAPKPDPAPPLGRSPPLAAASAPEAPDRGGLLFGGTLLLAWRHRRLRPSTECGNESALSSETHRPRSASLPVGPGAIHVERYGHGGTPIVLVHGFGTSGFLWRMSRRARRSAPRGHRARSAGIRRIRSAARYGFRYRGPGGLHRPSPRRACAIPRTAVAGVDLGGASRCARGHAPRPGVASGTREQPDGGIDARRRCARAATQHCPLVLRVATGVLGVTPLLTPVLEAASRTGPHAVATRRQVPRPIRRTGRRPPSADVRCRRRHRRRPGSRRSAHANARRTRGIRPMARGRRRRTSRAAIPDGQFVRLPGVGRLVPEDMPEELARLMLDFVKARKSVTPTS